VATITLPQNKENSPTFKKQGSLEEELQLALSALEL